MERVWGQSGGFHHTCTGSPERMSCCLHGTQTRWVALLADLLLKRGRKQCRDKGLKSSEGLRRQEVTQSRVYPKDPLKLEFGAHASMA